jgi:hypothetical protein
MMIDKIFERGTGDWDKLYNFMDENDFSNADFLACVCANLSKITYGSTPFNTTIAVAGYKWDIKITPEKFFKDVAYTILFFVL